MNAPLKRWLWIPFCGLLAGAGRGQETPADVLENAGPRLRDPAQRLEVVDRLRDIGERRRQEALEAAAARGVQARALRPNGAIQEVSALDGGELKFLTTHNASAAISTGADLVRSAFAVNGAGVVIGMWDGGSGRASHQEFGGRLLVMDGAPSVDHATHVGGTLAAAGIVTSARGMAPAATIHSYDWNQDLSEMTGRAASAPGQADKLYVSNHSYGFISGWNYVNNGTRVWEWHGNGSSSTALEQDFGRYSTFARDQDALAHAAPYYLIFRSAGNERVDNPSAGQNVALSPGSSTVVAYDPAAHPAGDGSYRSGFDTLSNEALAKNVMSVGSVTDAVTSGSRDQAKAKSSGFSSWGPTDDGRIKPDLVANGDGVYSALNGSNTSYGTYSGTSMSSPNAAGSAALLIHHYGQLFPGEAMRASTLKGLLLHTADDLGHPGPDYRFGWGLMNAKAAADLIDDHQARPLKQRMTEDNVGSAAPVRAFDFVWDGTSPIRATLCWTDPAGTATTTSDLRSPRLVHDLDLRILGPGGSEHLPFVMPFVGTWTQGSMDLPATTGINRTDNVEQVLVAAPQPGTYRVEVSFPNAPAGKSQIYSLILTGAADEEPPPPPLSIVGVSPPSALTGTVVLEISGSAMTAETAVRLERAGHASIAADFVETTAAGLRCRFELAAAAPGAWDVTAENPDGESATLGAGFTLLGALWSESFDGTVSGWSSVSVSGSSAWQLTTATSHSPPRSQEIAGPETKSVTALVSPSVTVPADASDLQLKFWHRFATEAGQDGGRLEFSVNGGAWTGVDAANSGTAFASNGYNTTIRATGPPNRRSAFAGLAAWSGNSGGFAETIVNFNDTARFAGNSLRLRWLFATNDSIGGSLWHIDSIALIGGGNLTNLPPVVTAAADTDSPESTTDADGTVFDIVREASVGVAVGADDDGGEETLHYTWSSAGETPVFFTPNGTNAAKQSTAAFEAPGDYRLTVAITDAGGFTVSSEVDVRVAASPAGLTVAPAAASLAVNAGLAFGAALIDQFGQTLDSPPGEVAWSASGGGTVDTAGNFHATDAGGPFVVSANADGFSGTASVSVTPATASVALNGLQRTFTGDPLPVEAVTDPAGLAVEILYDGSLGAPVAAGTYAVEARITDPNYQGDAAGTLVIDKAHATIEFGPLSFEFDGAPKAATATTSPAGLAVEITYDGSPEAPSAAGTYVVQAQVADPNHHGSATGELVIVEPETESFAAWSERTFPESTAGEPDADPDHDGLTNLAEYALGTDPLAFTPAPTLQLDDDFLTLEFQRPKDLPDVTCHAEISTDAVVWQTTELDITASTGTHESMRVQIPRGNNRLLLRLRFELR